MKLIGGQQENEQLKQRILAAFPAGHYALDTFFRLSDVTTSKEVETAAVECLSAPRLLLNPDFIAKNCKTDEHLFILVMHELYHVLMGHTRLFQRLTPLDNLAFDAIINAVLCQLFQEPMYLSFFQNYYKPDELPGAILRPPPGWPESWDIPKELPKPVQEMIRVLYSESSGTYKEVYDLFRNNPELELSLANAGEGEGQDEQDGKGQPGEGQDGRGRPVLLGDHSPEGTPGRGESAANHPALNGAVRSIVEKWPMPPEPIRGRSVGNDLKEIILNDIKRPPSVNQVLKRMVKKMVEAGKKGGQTNRSVQLAKRGIESPIPTLRDRRAFVTSAFDWTPLVFRSTVLDRRIVRHTGLTTIYVDVSGSTRAYWKTLAGLVLPFIEKGLVRLFVFSEIVDEVSPAKLVRGRFKTTGGTDADCIWAHATQNEFKKIIILTDGYVGAPSSNWQRKLKKAKMRIRVALTPDGYLPDLEKISEEIVELPGLEG